MNGIHPEKSLDFFWFSVPFLKQSEIEKIEQKYERFLIASIQKGASLVKG
jgi:hypothetical protein